MWIHGLRSRVRDDQSVVRVIEVEAQRNGVDYVLEAPFRRLGAACGVLSPPFRHIGATCDVLHLPLRHHAVRDVLTGDDDPADCAVFVCPRASFPGDPLDAAVRTHQPITAGAFRRAAEAARMHKAPAVVRTGKNIVEGAYGW